MGTAYNNSFKIEFKNDYSSGEIKRALMKLFDIYPILKARIIINDGELPVCCFDAKPEIDEGSLNDIKSFVRPFELDKSLSRFLIVEDISTFLCIDIHHLIFDVNSLNVLLDNLNSILNNEDIDFVDDGILRQVSLEEKINSEYMDEAKKFFDSMLADMDEVYELLPSVNNENDDFLYSKTFEIDNGHLTSFLENHSLTYNQFFTGVFAYTLSRFTGSSKVLFNLIDDGREYIDLSESVGMFVKTLPVLFDCTNDDISSFFKNSSNLINSVMKCDMYPFRILAHEYDLNSNILFNYSHNVLNNNPGDYAIEELEHNLQSDFSFNIFNFENKLVIKILYSNKYSKELIERFTKSYGLILNEMLDVNLLSNIDYSISDDLTLLDSYNRTENNLKFNDILDAFNHNLSMNHNNRLVSYGDNHYTYGEGAFIADKIAKKLSDLNICADDCVGFLLPRSELYMFSILGILSAGAAFVPLDDNHPDERLRFILEDTSSKVVIVSDDTYNRVNNLTDDDVVLLNISNIIKEDIGSLSTLPVVYSDWASVLYTSGTTGVPKGVKITRKALINFAEFYIKKYELSQNDIFALFASISFDVSMEAIFSTLCAGACLNIIPEDIKLNMELMNDYFIDNGVNYTHLPAQVAKLFISQNDNIYLKVLCTGGEKLGKIEKIPDCRFVDSYGPTEAFIDVTSIDVDEKIDDSSIGFLFDNIKAYILDDEFRRVPLGAVGELYLAGYQIAEGYLNREEETNRAFIDNLFDDSEDYKRLYRTGDMVRFLPDGSLAFVNRRDNQVKIRGNRVELSEIESIIREIDNIEDVTVQTVKNGSNNELVAYVVPVNDTDDASLKSDVCDYIGEYKPDYMVPSFVIKLDKIPLNVNGKVDKRNLPDVDISGLKVEYVAPRSEVEKLIVDSFEKVFNQDKIGVNDDFIRLGGDSLTAIKLVSCLNDYNISAADILSLRTPKAISESINKFDFDLDMYSLEEGCPLNEPQLNVYLDIIAHNKINSYILPYNICVSKKYDLNELVDALNLIVDAHPILTMRISDEFEVPYLVKGSRPPISIEQDICDEDIKEFIIKEFDLNDSLCRFLIVENDEAYNLFAVFHHLIFDGLSAPVFKQNLFDILDGKSIDVDDSFLRVSAFNSQIKDSEEFDVADEFFNSLLVDSDDAGVLLDSPCPDGPGTYITDLNVDIEDFINKYSVSENVLFTSVFAYTLSRFVGSEEVLFNIIENGRDRFNNLDAIGMYANTIPLLVDCKNQNVSSFMDYMSDLVYGVMKYNYYPFRLLANKYNVNSNIIFQFVPDWFENEKTFSDDKFDKYITQDMIQDMDDFISDFSLNVIQKGDTYKLSFTYSDKFSKNLIVRFAQSFSLILDELTKVNQLSKINYTTSEDLELLDEYNKTETPLVYNDVLYAFNDNLSKYPDNNLISDIYTYGEVAFISDKIAKKLMDLGVRSQDNVAFLVERSELYLFSILSTLSIGAVYVPIDDKYPDERVKFILDDVKSSVVLVSDETYSRVSNLAEDAVLLNISEFVKEDIGSLSHLPVSYGDLACILYTSGTTGVPKGVKITRKAILNFVEFYVNDSNLSGDDVYGLFASIGFDVAIKGIFSSIYAGASLNIIPEDIKLDMEKLNKYFAKHGVTHTHITTQVAKLFINSSKSIPLTELVTGGEKLGEIDYPRDCRFIDTYGPTEACVYVTSINEKDKIDSSSVGHLLNNLKAYILDENLNRVPMGAAGELYLAGYQIAEGYLNREEETERAFINNPFTEDKDYSILYRTGDIARFLDDGSIDIVGRRDGQVKVRGNRVELSEVELVIREIDFIEDITVQAINNDLVAYVVLTKDLDDGILNDLISDYVGERKPEYMVPSFILKLDNIPLTVNGKVDRRALPEVDINDLRADYVAPSNENERLIVEAFEKVFNQEKISIYDDFIRLGGDSLTAIKLISHLKEFNVSVADVLSLRTPKLISGNVKIEDSDLDIYSLESGCPLNESQLNIYLDIIAHEKSDSYLIHVNAGISKEFDIGDIINALDVMFEAHPILGMRVSDEFEVPYLVKGVKPQVHVGSDVSDEFLFKPFDLYNSLCRFLIVENNGEYVLYSVFHHIIFDALSEKVFKEDLISILKGNSVDVDDSFLKVSAFNKLMKDSEDYRVAKKFYEYMLVDIDESGTLLDCVLPDGPGFMKVDLDVDFKSFKSFLHNCGISENVLFTSVFAYTLSRFAGNDKVAFNIIENGRDRFSNFNSIGMYVNTLPLLVDCKNQNIESFMDYMANLIYDVMKYNYYPFRLLSNEYGVDSNILFQFIPDWIGNDEEIGESESMLEDMFEDRDDLISDFSADVIQKGEKYWLNVEYSDKYSKDMINRFIGAYKLILNEILYADQLSDINYVSQEDLEFLNNINKTESSLNYADILDAFNENLNRNPNNALVSYNDVKYSYAEAAFIANKISEYLTSIGVRAQDNVAFLVERSELYMFCVLGIMSGGGVCVPLDDAHPDERIEFILDDSDSGVIIVSDETFERGKNLAKGKLLLNISDFIPNEIKTLPYLPNSYGDLACILYTSGTTGVPKGVKITRKAILNLSEFYVKNYDFTEGDVFGLYSSIGFDAAFKALFSSIYAGACVAIIPDDVKLDINLLNNYFVKQGINHGDLPTQIVKLFLSHINDVPLDILFTGGEKLGEFNIDLNCRFVDAYGPTEAFVEVSTSDVNDKIDSSSIGHLVDNIKAYILDDDKRRVPVGGVGELYLAGYQIARGYLNRESETKDSFINNPFDDREGYDVMYRTGDLARVLPDGSMGIVGRLDDQVKIRGNRVELTEVESVIHEIDWVEDVSVQTIKNGDNTELVAYVVISEDLDNQVLKNDISNFVVKYKPEYMVPSFIVKLDEIPLTVNGKVDKRSLPEVDLDSLHAEYVAATNETEKIIMESFEEVFGLKNVSLIDNFVNLGGDSITAIRLVSLLEKSNISCTARDILLYKSPYLIAQHANIKESIYYDAVEGEVDLLPIQSYFFDHINIDAYVQSFIVKSSASLNIDFLQRTFDELANYHDMLRVVYDFDGDKRIQKIQPVNTRVCEINEYYIGDNFEENMRDIFINSSGSINMKNHLMDINLIHYGCDDYISFVFHHLIIDGVSWNNLLVDLSYIYSRLYQGKEIELLRPYPYKYWVEDVKELVNNISDEEKQHWIEVNNSLDDSCINGKSNVFVVNMKIKYDVNNLLMLSEEEYLALAISRAYKKTYGEDIIFGRESHGRDETIANLSRTIGWFTSEYPVPVEVCNGYDNVSLMKDAYSLKKAFNDINNLGLNYGSLIYITNELEFKHCPVTFNFLSNEFVFKNKLFESVNNYLLSGNEISSDRFEHESYGITFNISSVDGYYLIDGNYASDTYIGNEFDTFIDNIRHELDFIANYGFDDGLVCCLSEPQMGIYLDEKVNKKENAYLTSGTVKCNNASVDEIEDAIQDLINKHPILKSRILDTGDMPILICDRNPLIKVVDTPDYSSLVKPFDLNESLARFFIINNENGNSVYYNIHHLISDAVTCGIIENELIRALNEGLDEDIDLGFIYASKNSFESKFEPEYKSAQEFFNKQFSDIDDVQYLSSDVDGSMGKISLPIRGIRNRVEEFAQELGITVGNFLNTVFAYTYSRFTGSDKVYYTFNEHGRHEEYSQNAVGMFVRTIPILVDCKNKSISDFISEVSSLILKSMTNSIYPFRLVASDFGLNNDVGFEYNYDLNDVSNIGDEIVFSDDVDTVSEFSCVVNDLDDGYVVGVNYLDKFSQDTVIRFVNVFKEVLIQFLDKNELKDIDYISDDDIKLLDSYNQTESPLNYSDILDAFNNSLSKCPDNKLVSYNDVSYTYGEGAYVAKLISDKLNELGVKAQDNVAFLVERSELYMFSVLGILSAGAVYVPLDDAYPDDRIQFILEDTCSSVLIVDDNTYERAELLTDDAILLNISDLMKEGVGTLDELPVVYGDLVCILYTSGTTGIPKGVKITRKSVLNLSEFYIRKYGLGEDDVYALFASIGFDVAMKAIFPTICSGACLTVIPNAIKLDMASMNDYFMKYGVTHTEISTQVAKLFISQVDETSLKVLTTGGEKLGESEIDVEYRFVDSYGPTEACVDVTCIDSDDRIDPSSIGFLLDNIKAYVLDDEFRRVPIGAVGELYLAGNQIADGYLNRDEETMKAFLENPFDEEEDYGVMYRTGDIVRVLPDGSLGIVGRRDSQVKIRGNRVELSEIESVIHEIGWVEDVSVHTIKNGTNNELIAYVVTADDVDDNSLKDLISSYVGERKPEYMIPSFIVKLDEIPLTVNGKVDKSALPEVDLDSLHAEYVAPTTETEKIIVESFENVFNQDKIGVNDDFVRLGGDSLTAIKLLFYLKEYNLTAADILSLRTPRVISESINKLDFDLDIYSLEEGCPLTEPQLNVYLDIMANDKLDSYIIPLFMEISNNYDIDNVTDALDEMFDVHPILGMCVSDEFEVPYLVKGLKPSVTVQSDIDEDYIKEFLTREFELSDSLSRFLIVENDDNYKLYAVFHHIIFDALSEDAFKKHLQEIMDGKSVDIDDSFLKTSAFTQQIQNTKEFDDACKFYDEMLVDSEDCGVLLDEITLNQSGIHRTDLDLDLDLFKSFLHDHGVSENILFTSAFAYTLSRFAGSSKVKFNIVENGRDRFNNLDSIGMYVNTLPVLVDCKNQAVSDFIEYSSNLIYGVMKYNYYPFRLLASKYNVDSNILFQFMPDWFNDSSDAKKDSLLQSVLNNFEDGDDSIADFTFEVIQKENGYYLSVSYSEKYSKEMVERFAESYKLILSQIIGVNNLLDIDYSLKSDLEILDTYNQTEYPLVYDDVLDAFNDNLSKYPNNKLVSMDDVSYSYAEGAFIADKIAKRLKDLNVSVQDSIGFLVPRSEHYMFSVLGILSMGGVYVPLDDKLPDERIKFILEDSASKVVIVSDETYNRARGLSEDIILLNISEIFDGDIDSLSSLPIEYCDLACILYTSGTTGIPKGVKITRKSIVNLVTVYQDRFGLSNNDVYGLFSTIGFDAALLAICSVLYSGACLSIVPDDMRLNIDALNNYFISQNVSHTLITSQVGKLFVQEVEETSLDVLLVGGEKLGEFESPKDYVLVDAFGPTEACVFVSSIRNSDKLDSSSIGYLSYNTKAYVLDDELRRVPMGAVGELCVAGYQLADGYLNNEKENKQSFLDNPFDDSEEYQRLYRTGDMVRLLPDGSLSIVGRRDSQVKIRGNRVETSEVESVIREIREIEDVTIQTIKNGSNNELVAYAVPVNDMDDNSLNDLISKYVGERKPEYMVPSFVVKLDAIPLTVNGKVNKSALPEIDLGTLHAEYVAPTTETEKAIVESFEKVFNRDKIGVNDDFVRLGGDSLLAIKLISHLKDYNISVADILGLHTPKAIAQNIEKINLDLDAYSLESGCPLNEPQLNVYLDIISRNDDPYTIPLDIDIPKEYSVDDLVNALDVMFEVHPILAMKLNKEFEIPYLVKANKPFISYEHDMSEEIIKEFKNKSFDLEESLCRFLIVENDGQYTLHGVFHHLIFDALSNLVFKQDLMNILKGKSIAIDDSFLKVAAFNSQIKNMKDYDEAKTFYDMMLFDSEDAGTLLDDVCPDNPGIYNVGLDIDVNEFIDKYNVSENVLFTSVFAYTLSRFAGNDNVLFNIIENGRSRFDNFNSIGMYVNTLPISVDCKNNDISSFMEYMSNLVYDVMKYNYYPFRLLAKEHNVDSNILFQFMPEWVGDGGIEVDGDDSPYHYEIEDRNAIITDFSVAVVQKGDKYRCSISYSDKYSRNMVERFAESYKLILHEILNVDQFLDVNCVSKADLEILNNINKTETPLVYDDVLDAFNDNLSKYPDNNLISDIYTYGETAFIADEIAKKLIDLGVKSQDNVAFLVERSELYLFSILSTLSIGAVYVPIDDKYPDERVKFILDDVKSSVVLVSDETYSRVSNLAEDAVLLNISEFVKENIGSLSHLPVSYGDLACILYTSGTTGVPKGVKITRKAILNFVEFYVNNSKMSRDDIYGLFASIGFDVAIKGIFSSIYAGAALNIVPKDIKLDMDKLNKYFTQHGVTHTHITTQVAKLFINCSKNISLKELVTGGEKLGEIDYPHDCRFVDTYGPTEACVYVTSINEKDKIDSSSVGHLLNNLKAYILDENLNRVPMGAAGELYLAGYQIAEGYLNREEETEKAFINNPFTDDKDYSILYRTGDIARFLDDGSIDIVGRRDGQVKVRGNRVELSEIESVIRSIDDIEDVTVQTVSNNGNNELVAYVVSVKELDGIDLRNIVCDYVKEHKPDYMVPSYVVGLDEIPLTVNGKVNKSALPEVDINSLRGEYVAPENDVEAFFAKCFEEILGIEKVGAEDNFFEMGGDSLLVIKIIIAAINEGFSINYGDVFDNPTPRDLSRFISLKDHNIGAKNDNYDYTLIDNLLKRNNWDSFVNGRCAPCLGNVLLTGATGFLGIHILYELLQTEPGDVYCLIRPKDNQSGEDRLKYLWDYYFERDYSEFENKIHVVEGNITNYDDFKKLMHCKIDAIINSAANVKHYAQGSEIKDINFGGAINALEFAKTKKAKFIQISTVSVAGERVNDVPSKDVKLYENKLFINQNIDNKYVESKFLAERAVLEAAIDNDLDVKIMRVGNLMARSYDSMFQINYDTNAFVNNLKSFVTIGKMPLSYSKLDVDFSPIDINAKSIVELSKTPKNCRVFHIYPDHNATYGDLIKVFNQLDLNIEFCDQESFDKDLNEILGDGTKQSGIFGLLTHLNSSDIKYDSISADNEYTLKLLKELGIKWPKITEKYLYDFIKLLKNFDFFKYNVE